MNFLQRVSGENYKHLLNDMKKCKCLDWQIRPFRIFLVNLGEHTDCPVFEGLYQFCQLYSSGSIGNFLFTYD